MKRGDVVCVVNLQRTVGSLLYGLMTPVTLHRERRPAHSGVQVAEMSFSIFDSMRWFTNGGQMPKNYHHSIIYGPSSITHMIPKWVVNY